MRWAASRTKCNASPSTRSTGFSSWNLTQPEKVLAIQRRYAEVGSDCILTNTFGGSRIMLNRHSNAGKVVEINRAGVEILREAFGGRDGYVVGDIGPFGGLLEP